MHVLDLQSVRIITLKNEYVCPENNASVINPFSGVWHPLRQRFPSGLLFLEPPWADPDDILEFPQTSQRDRDSR